MSTLPDSKQPASEFASAAPSISAEPTVEMLTGPNHPHLITRLSGQDLAIVCHSIGGSTSVESQAVLHPTSWIYPPKGLPDGLYKDVIRKRVHAQFFYHLCSIFFNTSLVLQLVFGALLTALASSQATGKDVLITVLAALNTVNAGLLALLHNSGLPDRYQKDWDEYDRVESFLRELMDTGIVMKSMSRDEVVEYCYARFRRAKETIAKNMPAAYTATEGMMTPSNNGNGMRLS
ncbi:Uncharacterized protein BP5553_00655 [Venustampulla echinocandica]|uniref:SMODS and SLOG-associating 2TM effector domain-containing protein n=1 Tax=Venustampulla echinocandica TaxID=2656787 RepID=A0A370TYS1_9HELO|nr:Uncharacterized protein BP5553_00655 [Venustampulla echinocandica]RDL40676.1 Uncharacterized protein BP5553_00655 [Venustampulla echinocandica]